jgi:nitrogen fixation NifU-like protein
MADLEDLYQEVILDHNKTPRNFRAIKDATHKAEGYNPLCGDQVTVYVRLRDGLIEDISFQGSGCAISKASASMMTAELKGKPESDAAEMFEKVHRMLTGDEAEGGQSLGKLAVLSGVCKFPARVKCATLAWHTLNSALKGGVEVASTE